MRVTPTEVLIKIGQSAVMKMTKTAEGWALLKVARESGSQASGGIVRRTWKIGSSAWCATSTLPMKIPRDTPTSTARP